MVACLGFGVWFGCGLVRDLVFLVVCCFVFVWWWVYCGWLTLGGWLLDLVVCYCYVLVDAQFVTLVDVLVGFMFGLTVGVLVYFLACGSGVGYCGYFLVRHAIGWLVRVLVLPLFGCCACGFWV